MSLGVARTLTIRFADGTETKVSASVRPDLDQAVRSAAADGLTAQEGQRLLADLLDDKVLSADENLPALALALAATSQLGRGVHSVTYEGADVASAANARATTPFALQLTMQAEACRPMALAFGEAGQQNAPLGRAVIGGLAAATLATLLVLPGVFALLQKRVHEKTPSLDPDDPDSAHYVPAVVQGA